MQIDILSVGRPRDKLADELLERYLGRLKRFARVGTAQVPEAGGKGRSVDETKRLEAERLSDWLSRRAAGGAARVIALDERGTKPTTRELSTELEAWTSSGIRRCSFVIGGADGLDRSFVARADKVLALSALTFPHDLVRVILAEQLYRCLSLLAGHPYHRD
jgi:23S rRNA (pseudouridine1915-N3)-methyltransferase